MPARMLATPLLQYHQKPMLVTTSASFTGLGRFPCAHIRAKLIKNRIATAMAVNSIICCAARNRPGKI